MYTIESLDKAIEKHSKWWISPLHSAKTVNRTIALDMTVQYLWANQIPEDEETKILREAWTDIHVNGCFNYA